MNTVLGQNLPGTINPRNKSPMLNTAPGVPACGSWLFFTQLIPLKTLTFYPTGCVGTVVATLSWLDQCDHKLEAVQTCHTCSYHGLVVQCYGQTRV